MNRSRRRDDDDDDDDDRPRRRRRDDDEDDDDRPRSRRRRDEDDEDDRPRRRRDDEDDRPARRPRRKSRGPSTGKVLAIVGGIAAVVGVIVLVVFLVRGGIGGANISYAKFKEIKVSDTIETLEKRFGKPTKLEKSEWGKVKYADERGGGGGFGGGRGSRGEGSTLADLDMFGNKIEAWYHWHSGSEDIYVASGKDFNGKNGLVMKVYTNSNALRENERAGGDFSKMIPHYEVRPVD
jgi:hypothetical protein